MGLNAVGTVKDTTEVLLYHPRTGSEIPGPQGKPLSVTIHGPYSAKYKSFMRKQQQARLQNVTRQNRNALNITAEELEAGAMDLIIACIESWNMSFEGDKVLALTEENIREVFKQHPWVRDQIDAAMGNAADFLEPPTTH